MGTRQTTRLARSLEYVRIGLWIWLVLVGVLWGSSYFVGLHRYGSGWVQNGEAYTEQLRWCVSNHGSFGYAWQSQWLQQFNTVPPDELEFYAIAASTDEAYYHSAGSLAWHWIHYTPDVDVYDGSVHGSLFIPYWMPMLAMGLMVMGISRYLKKQSGR